MYSLTYLLTSCCIHRARYSLVAVTNQTVFMSRALTLLAGHVKICLQQSKTVSYGYLYSLEAWLNRR